MVLHYSLIYLNYIYVSYNFYYDKYYWLYWLLNILLSIEYINIIDMLIVIINRKYRIVRMRNEWEAMMCNLKAHIEKRSEMWPWWHHSRRSASFDFHFSEQSQIMSPLLSSIYLSLYTYAVSDSKRLRERYLSISEFEIFLDSMVFHTYVYLWI